MDFLARTLSRWANDDLWRLHDAQQKPLANEHVLADWMKIRAFLATRVPKEGFVVVRMPHGAEAVIAILACLAEGIPFVPALPDWPANRIEQICNALGSSLLLDAPTYAEAVRTPAQVPGPGTVRTSDLAYVMFTSGTTGKPKGVAVRRSALENFWTWLDGAFTDIPASTPHLLVTRFTFDISLLDLGLFLLRSTHLYPSQFTGNVFLLGAEIESGKIAVLNTVPNNISVILRAGLQNRCDLSTLKYLFVGGAKFSHAIYEGLRNDWKSEKRIFNFYGPTETTIYTHVHELTGRAEIDAPSGNVTVGKSIEGTTCRVVDPSTGNMKPAAEIGEVLLGGAQLMAGYFGDAATTQKALLALQDVVYFRTGDLGYLNEAGRLFVVGRLDETVKRRGYRVNLLDIDSYLQRIPGVRDCMTLAIPDGEAETRLLTVFLVDAGVTKEALYEKMRELLLEYQVPDELVFADSLPTNPSGKVDRKQLTAIYAKSESP